MCVWIWLYGLIWALLPILGWGRYGPEPFGLSCSLAWAQMKHEGFSFVLTMFSLNLVAPCVLICGCYFGIAINLYVTYKKTMNNANRVPNIIKLHRRLLTVRGADSTKLLRNNEFHLRLLLSVSRLFLGSRS